MSSPDARREAGANDGHVFGPQFLGRHLDMDQSPPPSAEFQQRGRWFPLQAWQVGEDVACARWRWCLLLAVLSVAAWFRFVELGRAAVRADEITFHDQVARGLTVLELWRNPPWLNQIPFVDTFTMIWNGLRPGPPDERTVREPYALIGTLTVAGVVAWLARRRGLAAAALLGAWMSLLPFHVYQSRDAYYYVAVMAFAGGLSLHTADMLVQLRRGESPPLLAYVAWTAWAVPTCLAHMSSWVVVLACWLLILAAGVVRVPMPHRTKHVVATAASAGVVGLFMARWVWRALAELQRTSQSGGHIGAEFVWVLPRVLLMFTAGINALGGIALLLLLGAGAWVFLSNLRKPVSERDHSWTMMTVVAVTAVVASAAYVGVVGGGKGKFVYFSAVLPIFLTWGAYTLDVAASGLPGKLPRVARVAMPCLAVLMLAKPAWMITRLEGKPTPYKKIREWLDANLDPGTVVVVDRWYETWNEMARYAPNNVVVTFTVPDEPYELKRQLRWDEVTREAFENGSAQGFIRMVRNYEDREGVWTWPETYFRRRGRVVNEVGVWLRDRGFAPVEEFYLPNQARMVTEIFYDRREDILARKQAAGEKFAVFWDPPLRYIKTGPLDLFPIQTERFMDWRLLEQSGTVRIHNVTDTTLSARAKIVAVSPRGTKVLVGPQDQRFEFGQGQLQEWVIELLDLRPGENSVWLVDPRWTAERNPLLIAEVDVQCEPARP